MSYQFPPDLGRLVHERLASGNYASEDEILLHAMRALEEIERRGFQLKYELSRRIENAGTSQSQPLNREAFKVVARERLGRSM